MSKKLFVGNLPFDVNDADLSTVLAVAGKVVDAKVIVNKKTGRSKGYGFVEMETEAMAQEAVQKFEGATLNERALTVQLATPKQEADAKTEAAAETAAVEATTQAQAGAEAPETSGDAPSV
jgi:RNA recognition motif-containing protein